MFKLTIYRHPDGTIQGRPYVTDESGKYVCEGFLDDGAVERLQGMIDVIASVPAMLDLLNDLYHQLATDSDLENVTAAKHYAELTDRIARTLAQADPGNPQISQRLQRGDFDATTANVAATLQDAYRRAKENYTTDDAHEITEEVYYEALEVLPPVYGDPTETQVARFWLGEPYTHSARGIAVLLEYWKQRDTERYFCRLSECQKWR